MTTRTAGLSPLTRARVAGLLYFTIIPLGIVGDIYVPSKLIVSGDAAATANNILASESLFRLGLVGDLLASIIMLLVVLSLYQLLKPVNKTIATLMVMFVVVASSIAMLNQLNQLAALQILSGADFLKVFTAEQLQALAYLFLRFYSRGGQIAFILWGLWLLPLGYLVFKSGFLPKILGVLLILACFGYVLNSFAILLGYNASFGLAAALGELLFPLWLLIKGVNAEQWEIRAAEAT